MSDEILVRVENVSKKFCRSLKKSLWYGVRDIFSELNPFGKNGAGNLQLGDGNSPAQIPTLNSQLHADGQGEMSNSAPPLATRHSSLRKDEFWAVNDVSFELKRGECLGLIGHNGAGKTTLLKMLNGLIKPDHGRIEMRGRVGALIALGAGFNPILTGRENIYVNGSVLGLTKREIDAKIEDIIDFADIREFIDSPVQGYSSGMGVRLGFAIAAHCQPDILLLDEVLAVGDVGFQAKCFNKLAEFRERGVAFILVSHNMHQISRYCDQVLYLKHGRVTHLGEAESGIEHFLRDMSAPEAGSANETTDWSRVYGSGKVILKKATFLNEAGEKIEQIKTGDTFSLAIDYECPGEDVDDSSLDVIIRDRDGTLFQGVSMDYGVNFGLLSSSGCLQIIFERFPANSQLLKFNVALLSSKTSEVYDWKRHIALKVLGNSSNHGRIFLNCRWENRCIKRTHKDHSVTSE
jgi:homopolymeric O-antigen transport system ATP-binding protein